MNVPRREIELSNKSGRMELRNKTFFKPQPKKFTDEMRDFQEFFFSKRAKVREYRD